MISTADFKRGQRVLIDGEPYLIEEHTVQTPSARGAATLVKVRLRNIVTRQISDRTFKAGEKFDEPDVLGESAPWLNDQLALTGIFFNGNAVGVDLPTFVEAEIDMVGGGSKGDTASGKNLKDATLTNGKTLKVPLFIESGEKVLVDTRTWEFAKRAKG
jgi:elongation factor P